MVLLNGVFLKSMYRSYGMHGLLAQSVRRCAHDAAIMATCMKALPPHLKVLSLLLAWPSSNPRPDRSTLHPPIQVTAPLQEWLPPARSALEHVPVHERSGPLRQALHLQAQSKGIMQ